MSRRIATRPPAGTMLDWGRVLYHPSARWSAVSRWHLTVGDPRDLGHRYFGDRRTIEYAIACSPRGSRVLRVDVGSPACETIERRVPLATEEVCRACADLWDDLGGVTPMRVRANAYGRIPA